MRKNEARHVFWCLEVACKALEGFETEANKLEK